MEVVAALAAFQQVLQQVEHLRVPLGLPAPLLLQGLRPLPDILVHQGRNRDLYPGVPRLVVGLRAVFGGDVTLLSVDPGARIGGVRQNVMDVGLTPQQLAGLCGDSVVGQPHGNRGRPHLLMDVHVEDAANNLRLLLDYLRPAVVSDAVSVGEAAGGHPSLLGRPTLAQSGPLPEVVQLYLADGRHESEGLHVDGVHDGFQPNLMGLDDLHEGGCGVHAPAEPVGLPADDGVEAPPSGVGQQSLELWALLRPAPADLLVAGGDGQPLALAVGFHLGGLLGYGCLVLPVLALVRNAGVDGRAIRLRFPIGVSRHDRLLSFSYPLKPRKTRLLSGAGLRVVQCYLHHLYFQVAPRPGVFQHRRANLFVPIIIPDWRGGVKEAVAYPSLSASFDPSWSRPVRESRKVLTTSRLNLSRARA